MAVLRFDNILTLLEPIIKGKKVVDTIQILSCTIKYYKQCETQLISDSLLTKFELALEVPATPAMYHFKLLISAAHSLAIMRA